MYQHVNMNYFISAVDILWQSIKVSFNASLQWGKIYLLENFLDKWMPWMKVIDLFILWRHLFKLSMYIIVFLIKIACSRYKKIYFCNICKVFFKNVVNIWPSTLYSHETFLKDFKKSSLQVTKSLTDWKGPAFLGSYPEPCILQKYIHVGRRKLGFVCRW